MFAVAQNARGTTKARNAAVSYLERSKAMTNNEAIEVLETLDFPCDKCTMDEACGKAEAGLCDGAFKIALSALREKQEREKGCEACNDTNTEFGVVSFPRTASGKVEIDKVEAVEAHFCPMCGRELKPKEAQA